MSNGRTAQHSLFSSDVVVMRSVSAPAAASPRRSSACTRLNSRSSVAPRGLAGSDLPGGGQELVEYANTGNLRKLEDLLDGAYAQEPQDASSKAVRVAQLRTAAQRAMSQGHVACLRRLLQHGDTCGYDFGFKLGNNRSSAVEAAGAGRADICRVLFENGRVSTELVNGFGRTALLEAALNGREECVRVCLEFGANVDFATKMQGNTAAHLAAQSGNITVLNILREHGANMNAERFGDLKTPLTLHREHVQKQMHAFTRK